MIPGMPGGQMPDMEFTNVAESKSGDAYSSANLWGGAATINFADDKQLYILGGVIALGVVAVLVLAQKKRK